MSPDSAPVRLFVLSSCPVCNTLKRLLDEHDIEYDAIDVDLLTDNEKKQAMDDLKGHNRMMSFPTLVAGKTVIAGYQKDKILELFNIRPPTLFGRFKRGLTFLKRKTDRQ